MMNLLAENAQGSKMQGECVFVYFEWSRNLLLGPGDVSSGRHKARAQALPSFSVRRGAVFANDICCVCDAGSNTIEEYLEHV